MHTHSKENLIRDNITRVHAHMCAHTPYDHTHHSPDGLEVGEQVSVTHKLCEQTQWLLDCHTSNEIDDMWVVALGDLFHGVNLMDEVSPLTSCCRIC